ncbi:hypothetical protein BJ165DRAFT_680170 [Panaeolus papilionaceus]|nr:hypothetical protein BJ165DRAFT_680170 [Panaeolus papilionaceus]
MRSISTSANILASYSPICFNDMDSHLSSIGAGEGSNGGDSGRPFPPLYVSTGEASKDRLAFIHILERLKTQKRTGWVDNKIPNPERPHEVDVIARIRAIELSSVSN